MRRDLQRLLLGGVPAAVRVGRVVATGAGGQVAVSGGGVVIGVAAGRVSGEVRVLPGGAVSAARAHRRVLC